MCLPFYESYCFSFQPHFFKRSLPHIHLALAMRQEFRCHIFCWFFSISFINFRFRWERDWILKYSSKWMHFISCFTRVAGHSAFFHFQMLSPLWIASYDNLVWFYSAHIQQQRNCNNHQWSIWNLIFKWSIVNHNFVYINFEIAIKINVKTGHMERNRIGDE